MKLKHDETICDPTSGQINRIECMSISSDMSKLAICFSVSNHVSIYDLVNKQMRDKFSLKAADKTAASATSGRQTFQVTGMEFSPDGERLAVGQSDAVIYVYKIGKQWAQKKSIVNKYSLQSAVCKLYWLPHGIIFSSIDGRVKWIQTQNQKMYSLINVNNSICVSLSYNQDQVVAGFLNGQIWTNWLGTGTGTVRESSSQLLTTMPTPPFALALTSTGYICAAGSDGRMLFQQVTSMGANNPTSSTSTVSSSSSHRTNSTSTNRQTIELGQDVSQCVSSPSGTVLIACCGRSLMVFELESSNRLWKHKLSVDLNGSMLITGICWSSDGTMLSVSTLNQAVLLFRCQWQSKLVANRFQVNYVGNRQLVIKDLQANNSGNQSIMITSNFDVQEVKIIKESFVVVWTTNTLIMASLNNPKQRSEIEWAGLTTTGVKFSFDYENIALISAVGELYLVQLGQNTIMGSVRTDFISPHLISVRMNERKSKSKVLAYLLDAKTIAVIDLITGLRLNTWSHSERIDWIELNETGHRMIYRDKALKLVLLLNIVQPDLLILLNSGCGFVQWVPGSDVIVAQCRDKLYVWYDYNKPVIHPITGGELNEALEIERSNGQTKVRFMQPNTDIILDEVLLEFDTAIDDGDLDRAEQFLQSLSDQSSTTSVNDLNSMWLTLGNLALKNLNLSVAERAFAAIGDLAKVNFIQQCQRDSSMLALLDSDWDRFESGASFDRVLETYLNTYNWDRAIKFVQKFGPQRQDLQQELQAKYYQWLMDTGQHSIAAKILERDGKLEQAIGLYMKSGRLGQLTKLIVENAGSSEIINKDFVRTIIADLERAEAFEEAGDLYSLPMIGEHESALKSYTKARSFAKAINLARVHFPDQVVSLENQYGEYLMNEMDDPATAVTHFIEAGRTERALEAAVQAKQFDRAAEIAAILDTVPLHLGKKIAEYYVQRDQLEPALEMYLNMSAVREAVQLLNSRGQYARAFKIAKQLLSADEAKEMYELIARSYEADGKLQDAERIYLACGDVDSAISMYKNQRQFDSMVRLVRQYHPALLNETCVYLARELETDKMYKQAEQYYLMAGEWQQSVIMYKNASLWEDAYRVSRANGGATAAKQVAFHWAQTMPTPAESVSLLNRFGLLNQVVDYSLESNEFEFALALIRNSPDLKHKLLDVRLKYAVWLENEGLFNEAEAMYLDAGKPKEAVVMYLHRNNFDDALRVAEQSTDDDGDIMVKDILTAQARFIFEQMKRTGHFDQLDRVEALLLRAGRIEVAVRLFRDQELWQEAVRMAEQYAPHMLDALRRDMVTHSTAPFDNHQQQQQAPPQVANSMNSDLEDNYQLISTQELTKRLRTAEQNADKESIVRYSMLLAGHLLKDHQSYESLITMAKHSSSTFILPDSKKLLSRIAVMILSDMDDELITSTDVYTLLRDSIQQLLTQNSSLNGLERESFEKYLLITHYMALKFILQQIMAQNTDSPAIASVKELHLKLSVSLLRYTDIVRADRAFLEAGLACRQANRIEMAFVFLNHFLDLLDAIEEQNFNVDHSDFVHTDIPYEVPLPNKVSFDEQNIEDIKGWVLQTSMDTELSQTLPLDPLRDGQVYEASLLNSDGSKAMACLVTGYPVVAKHKMIEFLPGKYVANKEDWNKLLMATKILDDQQLRQVLQFIGTLCGNANIVKFSFQ